MSTYTLMTKVITSKKKTQEDLLTMLDVFYAAGRLSSEEYTELVELTNTTYAE